jgi:hypothetical protein
LRRVRLKIQTSVRERMQPCWRFKIHTACLQQVNATTKHGLHLLKHHGHWVNGCCFCDRPTFAVTTSQSFNHY